MVRWLGIVAFVGLGLSGTAAGDDYARPGFYVGIGPSYLFESFSLDSDNLGLAGVLGSDVDPDYDNSAGVDVKIGYRVSPQLAAEFLYGFAEGFDSHAGVRATEIDVHLVSFNAKWFPLQGDGGSKLQPYGLLGAGTQIVNSEVRDPSIEKPWSTDAGFVGRFGVGVDYYVTNKFAVELEASYMLPAGGWVKHTDYASLSLSFLHRF